MRCTAKLAGVFLSVVIAASFLFFILGREEKQPSAVVPPFAVRDLTGRTVTNEVFAKSRVTALTVWRPGVRECGAWLDAAADMEAMLPEGAGVLGLVVGRSGLPDEAVQAEARSIAAQKTGPVVHLVAGDALMPLLVEVRTLPVTFFVNGESRLVGHPVAGSDPRQIGHELRALLSADPEKTRARQNIHTQIFR